MISVGPYNTWTNHSAFCWPIQNMDQSQSFLCMWFLLAHTKHGPITELTTDVVSVGPYKTWTNHTAFCWPIQNMDQSQSFLCMWFLLAHTKHGPITELPMDVVPVGPHNTWTNHRASYGCDFCWHIQNMDQSQSFLQMWFLLAHTEHGPITELPMDVISVGPYKT